MPAEAKAAIERGKAKALGGQALGWTMVWTSLSELIPSKVFATPRFAISQPAPETRLKTGEPLPVEVTGGEGVPLTSVQLYTGRLVR